MTIEELKSQRFKWELQRDAHYKDLNDIKETLAVVCALILQSTMLQLALEHPQIKEFSYEGEMVYDDESSYFWTANFTSDPELGGNDDWLVDETLRGYDEDQVMAAFDSTDNMSGSITVERLLEIFPKP